VTLPILAHFGGPLTPSRHQLWQQGCSCKNGRAGLTRSAFKEEGGSSFAGADQQSVRRGRRAELGVDVTKLPTRQHRAKLPSRDSEMPTPLQKKELTQLRHQVSVLKMERAILKSDNLAGQPQSSSFVF
jgi:hypothetical protein